MEDWKDGGPDSGPASVHPSIQSSNLPILLLTLALLGGLAPRAEAADRYWTGSGNWNDTANWSTTASGTGGSSVPVSSDIAYFGADASKDGNCSINATANVAELNIAAGYDGTITQGAFTITVGTTGWTQAGGTFTGSATGMTLNGPFSLSGGTFNAGSQTITFTGANARNWTVSGGTFNADSGTVQFYAGSVSFSITGTMAFNNLQFRNTLPGTGAATITIANTLTVNGTLSFTRAGTGTITLNTGTLEAKGDVSLSTVPVLGTASLLINGTGPQALSGSQAVADMPALTVNKSSGTLTLSGTIAMRKNLTYVAGTVDPGTSTVMFAGSTGSQAVNWSPSLYNVTFHNFTTGSGTHTVNLTGTLTVTGLALFDCAVGSGAVQINGGTLAAQGNVQVADANTYYGNTAFNLSGTANQTFTSSGGSGTFRFSPVTINKASGTVTLGSNLQLNNTGQQLAWTSGSLNLSTYTLTVASTISTGAGAEGLELATGGVLSSPVPFDLTCRSLKLGSDTFGYNTYNVLNTYTSIELNNVNFSTFFTGAGAKTIFVNPRPTVSITATTPDAYELPSPQAGVFTVDRGSRTDGALIVNYTLASGGANATPGAASDYTLSGAWVDGAYSGSVTIPNSAVSATITVTPVDDVIYDPAETVIPTLTASGNYTIGSSVATVTIHDNEGGNLAPVVSAGADRTVLNSALPIGATLNGSVTDDGQPTPVNLTKTWSQVSVVPPGGTATFADATDPGTTVSFDQEGVYVLQLLGNDSALQANDQVTISAYKRQVSVAVLDGAARATQTPTDTATFRVSRPATYTGEDLVVNYTLGGTATVGTDYSILPLSGSVIIPQGATDGDIVVTPVWKQDGAKTVVLTLTAGPVLAPYEITGANPPPRLHARQGGGTEPLLGGGGAGQLERLGQLVG